MRPGNKSSLLKNKMDAMGWLARTNEFVPEPLAQKMLQTFRETEVPLRDMETRRKYKHQHHDSSAVLTVC